MLIVLFGVFCRMSEVIVAEVVEQTSEEVEAVKPSKSAGRIFVNASGFTDEEKHAFAVKCVQSRMKQAEVVRKLIKAWTAGEISV